MDGIEANEHAITSRTTVQRAMTRVETGHQTGIRLLKCVLIAVALGAVPSAPTAAQSLRGSSASLDLQNRVAREHDFSFIETGERVTYFASRGWLQRVTPNRNFEVHAVSFPYARPEVATFVERLARQYRAACGEQLVVTSLTRPTTRQPRNASERSVHPTGMAVDLRYSRDRKCRNWLEGVLTSLESAGVLEATRERYPAHYHVAVFPKQYKSYVGQVATRATQRVTQIAYTVRNGDSLWTIARRLGTTVEVIKQKNGINGSKIFAGQVLEVPSSR